MADEIQMTAKENTTPGRVSPAPMFSPQVDIIETPESLTVLADVPGVKKSSLDVVLEEGVLTIRGEVAGAEEPGMKLEHHEYDVGGFYRALSVGRGLDAARAEANFKAGVLRLVIPRSEESRARRIEIKSDD